MLAAFGVGFKLQADARDSNGNALVTFDQERLLVDRANRSFTAAAIAGSAGVALGVTAFLIARSRP